MIHTKILREGVHKAGIYCIESFINGKKYIGSSVDLSKRVFDGHIKSLEKGNHHNRHLQNHVNKYGIDDLFGDI